MERLVQPEILDDLPAVDPSAVASRADLRRINALMGNAALLARQFPQAPHLRILELGAGDGTSLLKLARLLSRRGLVAEAILLDRRSIVSEQTRTAFTSLGWSIESVEADVFAWLKQSRLTFDVIVANLFLHHFEDESLRTLLSLAAARTDCFIACEPRRTMSALMAARLLGFIGCNAVTRHDALVSVRAGFAGQELSILWPAPDAWHLSEQRAGRFSHSFTARRRG